jgi:hypothetical protein
MMLPTEDSARQLNTLATEPIIELFKELGNARVAEVKAQKRVDKARNKLVLAARGPAQFFDGSGEKVGTITLGSRSSLDAKRFQAEAPIAAEIASRFRKKTWYFTVRSNMVMGALEEVIDSNGG